MECVEGVALEEGLGGGEKGFFAYEEGIGMGGDAGTDSDELCDAALQAESVDLSIEVSIGPAALEDVAEDEGAGEARR